MGDDIVERLRARADAIAENDAAVIESGGWPHPRWYAIETALREGAAEIERLRSWIDRQEPRFGYEQVTCPICHQATEYQFFGRRQPHLTGCPWRESERAVAAATKEDDRG